MNLKATAYSTLLLTTAALAGPGAFVSTPVQTPAATDFESAIANFEGADLVWQF